MDQAKVIWLCSWYPNDTDAFIGDFVQRQAKAVASMMPIHVLNVNYTDQEDYETEEIYGQLVETRIYLQRKNKIADLMRYKQCHEAYLKKYIAQQGKPNLIHVQIPMKAGMIALDWKRKYQIPFIVTEHYGIYNKLVEDAFHTRGFLFKYFTKKIIQQAESFLPVSQQLGADINEWVCKKAFVAVPNVVDTTMFSYEEKKHQGVFRFIHISNQVPLKNIDGLLKAILQLSLIRQDFEVYLIGGLVQTYIDWAKQHGIEKYVHFFGEQSYEEIAQQDKLAQAGLLFSYTESQSCVVLEWLCCGLPVISSAVGGVTELIQQENGVLVESGNVAQLANAMDQMITVYENYSRKDIALQASSLYSYEAVAKKIIAQYATCLKL
ncbi:MAG: glycosyltransferase family 4 protein [Chitinophagaceae bacterium]|nr:glycosyltransferase family 4 protein [Chitinophagaceae bacterium]